MTASLEGPRVPRVVVDAARLRHEGRLQEAVTLVEASLTRVRATPLDAPFRDRVLIGLTLADLYLLAGEKHDARNILVAELAFAEHILRLTRDTGSPDQVHAAAAGCYQLRDRLTQVHLLGSAPPEIDTVDWVQGGPTTLAEQRGRVVFMEFWATWCRTCAATLPFLSDLNKRFAEEGLSIVALASYKDASHGDSVAQRAHERELIRRTVSDHAVEFAVGIAAAGLRHQYGGHGIPTFVLIDPAGTVQLASSKPDKSAIESAVADLLSSTVKSCSN